MLDDGLLREWLEVDGHGGFASGTAAGIRTRRYHGLLCAAGTSGRVLLVSGIEATLTTAQGRFALSSHEYRGEVIHPDGYLRIEAFAHGPWPRWVYRCEDGSAVRVELYCARSTRETVLRFELGDGAGRAKLELRLLLAGRDYHSLHRENAAFRFEPSRQAGGLVFSPYDTLPGVSVRSNGRYAHAPLFFRDFVYREEARRGLDHLEDLGSPGVLTFEMEKGGPAAWVALGALAPGAADDLAARPTGDALRREEEERRAAFSPLELAADAYLVRVGERERSTIIAGYPWFTDWGRDTFVALRGLCLCTGRLAEAQAILSDWAGVVRDGLLPNFFPDGRAEPEYNSVDAALWYVIAVHDFLGALAERRRVPAPELLARLTGAVTAILSGFARGTRHGVRVAADGLLAAGAPGLQLTWMDAKVGDYVVTPRVGKPVEIQALWLNALRIGAELGLGGPGEFAAAYERGSNSFRERFWNAELSCLFDVVDVDHEPRRDDPSVRPNQIFAVGGLPYGLLAGAQARAVLARVESELYTPAGLRSLSPRDRRYRGRYQGGVFDRDTAYHMGTAWPWLSGAFVEAWLRVRGHASEARREARERFLAPWLAGLEQGGLGHVSEIADGDYPHRLRGAPFQAWSLAELLRVQSLVGTE